MKSVFFLLVTLFFAPPIFAQEENSLPTTNYSRAIVVQTDLEEPVANHAIICREIPKTIGLLNESDVVIHEIVTNESGEAILNVTDNKNVLFACESKELTTKDYCWYFPNSTMHFDIYDSKEDNKAIYLVGQTSPETCNKQLSDEEIKAGIQNLLPQGSALPFTNKNLTPEPPTPSPTIEPFEETETEITLWQWILSKIKSIFQKD